MGGEALGLGGLPGRGHPPQRRRGGGRRYGLAYTGTAPWGIGPFLWQNGGDWADWGQNKQTVDRPPAVEALLFVADLAQKHRAMPTPATNAAERPPSPTAGWRWR